MRKIPWQTPHCVERDGKLLLSEQGQEWLDQAVRRREKLAEEVRAQAGECSFVVEAPIRRMWAKAQESDEGLATWFKEADDESNHLSRRCPSDGCLERYIRVGKTGVEHYVPVVPAGDAALNLTWRRWVFLQVHIGAFGGHRLANQTMLILSRVAAWPGDRRDVEKWVEDCMTCLRFRRRPTKQEAKAVMPLDCEAWEEVMVDCEGPSNPADRRGNKYTLTYVCCLCHAALFEPMEALGHSHVRRAFARCIFRSGTLPQMIRSDRGPEFKTCLLAEFTALIGSRHRFGHAWRPMEQGMVERIHQEYQKILGMMLFDVFKCHSTEW